MNTCDLTRAINELRDSLASGSITLREFSERCAILGRDYLSIPPQEEQTGNEAQTFIRFLNSLHGTNMTASDIVANGLDVGLLQKEEDTDMLENYLRLVPYVNDIDLLVALHQGRLAKRLLSGHVNEEREEYVLRILTKAAGEALTATLLFMMRDVAKAPIAPEEKTTIRLAVSVLNARVWPTFAPDCASLRVPPEIQCPLAHVRSPIEGRPLKHLHHLATVTLSWNGSKEITVSGYQALILLQFADTNTISRTGNELVLATGIPWSLLQPVLHTLSGSKVNFLLRERRDDGDEAYTIHDAHFRSAGWSRKVRLPSDPHIARPALHRRADEGRRLQRRLRCHYLFAALLELSRAGVEEGPYDAAAVEREGLKRAVEEHVERMAMCTEGERDYFVQEIVANIFLGSVESVNNADGLRRARVSHIVCCCVDCPPTISDEYKCLVIPAWVEAESDVGPHFEDASRFVDEAVMSGTAGLVYCINGNSRSATFLIAYLIWKARIPTADALVLVKERRPQVQPTHAFLEALLKWERRWIP